MDELRKLVSELREEAGGIAASWNSPNGHGDNARKATLLRCADRIEAALAAMPEAIPPLTNGREYYIEHTGPHTVRLTPLSANSGGNTELSRPATAGHETAKRARLERLVMSQQEQP